MYHHEKTKLSLNPNLAFDSSLSPRRHYHSVKHEEINVCRNPTPTIIFMAGVWAERLATLMSSYLPMEA